MFVPGLFRKPPARFLRLFAAGGMFAGRAGWGRAPGKASGGSAAGKWAP